MKKKMSADLKEYLIREEVKKEEEDWVKSRQAGFIRSIILTILVCFGWAFILSVGFLPSMIIMVANSLGWLFYLKLNYDSIGRLP